VICDLSGKNANPNVMHELGIRLGISESPVILIREEHPDDKKIFDVGWLYTHEYNPKQYHHLEQHLIDKIKKFEDGREVYRSPVIRKLETSPRVIEYITYLPVGAWLSNTREGGQQCSACSP